MSIESAIEAQLPFLRAEAEAMMVDRGKALRPTGGFEYDPDLGADVEAADDLFASKGKAQARNLMAHDSDVGGRTSISVRSELHLPASTAPLQAGDLWEWTEVHDLSLAVVGQRLRVLSPVGGSMKTARRYEVEEVVS